MSSRRLAGPRRASPATSRSRRSRSRASKSSASNTAVIDRLIAAVLIIVGSVAAEKPPLTRPDQFKERAPEAFRATFETSKGAFVIEVHRQWAPQGADRFYNLAKNGFYDANRFFRVIDGVLAQVGMNGNPEIQSAWDAAL